MKSRCIGQLLATLPDGQQVLADFWMNENGESWTEVAVRQEPGEIWVPIEMTQGSMKWIERKEGEHGS